MFPPYWNCVYKIVPIQSLHCTFDLIYCTLKVVNSRKIVPLSQELSQKKFEKIKESDCIEMNYW